VLMDVGCKRPSVSVARSGANRTVNVGGQSFTFN
jgi:hypothetical protein